jgi:hypothetical protein
VVNDRLSQGSNSCAVNALLTDISLAYSPGA